MELIYFSPILGDFQKIWMLAEVRLSILKSNGNVMAEQLLGCMEKRSKIFFKNKAFLSAIFLDPRYDCSGDIDSFFTMEQRDEAIVGLFCSLYFSSLISLFFFKESLDDFEPEAARS